MAPAVQMILNLSSFFFFLFLQLASFVLAKNHLLFFFLLFRVYPMQSVTVYFFKNTKELVARALKRTTNFIFLVYRFFVFRRVTFLVCLNHRISFFVFQFDSLQITNRMQYTFFCILFRLIRW